MSVSPSPSPSPMRYPPNSTNLCTTSTTTDPAPLSIRLSVPTSSSALHEFHFGIRVEGGKAILKFICTHCEATFAEKVILEIPEGIIEEQCLSRIVKGV